MFEMPPVREDDRHAVPVRRIDHLSVPYRSSGLDDGRHARLCKHVNAVPEREEPVRGTYATGGPVARCRNMPPTNVGFIIDIYLITAAICYGAHIMVSLRLHCGILKMGLGNIAVSRYVNLSFFLQ